jgi:hypothetical protein
LQTLVQIGDLTKNSRRRPILRVSSRYSRSLCKLMCMSTPARSERAEIYLASRRLYTSHLSTARNGLTDRLPTVALHCCMSLHPFIHTQSTGSDVHYPQRRKTWPVGSEDGSGKYTHVRLWARRTIASTATVSPLLHQISPPTVFLAAVQPASVVCGWLNFTARSAAERDTNAASPIA